MTKLFLDTNVILDIYLPGRPGKEAARSILDLREACPEEIRLHLSILSVANIAYVLQKHLPRTRIREVLRDLFRLCQPVAMSDQLLFGALDSSCRDYEDALQIACAEADYCDFILTSNLRDFRGCTRVPVMTPAEFLARLAAGQEGVSSPGEDLV